MSTISAPADAAAGAAKCSCYPPHPHSRGNPVASPSQPSPLLRHLSPPLLPRGSSPAAAGDLRTRRALMAASSPWQRGAVPASVRRRALAGRAGVGPYGNDLDPGVRKRLRREEKEPLSLDPPAVKPPGKIRREPVRPPGEIRRGRAPPGGQHDCWARFAWKPARRRDNLPLLSTGITRVDLWKAFLRGEGGGARRPSSPTRPRHHSTWSSVRPSSPAGGARGGGGSAAVREATTSSMRGGMRQYCWSACYCSSLSPSLIMPFWRWGCDILLELV
jgi:hypothetical protein